MWPFTLTAIRSNGKNARLVNEWKTSRVKLLKWTTDEKLETDKVSEWTAAEELETNEVNEWTAKENFRTARSELVTV